MEAKSPSKSTELFKTTNLECQSFLDYLRSKQPATLEGLYSHPSICLAIYRELPELARQVIIRIMFVEQPVPQAIVSSWVLQSHAKEHTNSVRTLSDLALWRNVAIQGGLPAWELTPVFKKYIKVALLGGGQPWSQSHELDPDAKAKDVKFLDDYAMSRWRCVLHYMVGGTTKDETDVKEDFGMSVESIRVLLDSGLMKRSEENEKQTIITRQGFQFLLLDTQAQVWHFMMKYLDSCEDVGLSLAECLSLLFQLSFSILGRDYSTAGFSKTKLTFLQHLREFGLVYQRKRKAGRYYPTRLILNIATKRSAVAAITAENECAQDRVHIIVETNYRVYAYTDSSLQVALLGLFSDLLYRFPNLVVGVLTRDSLRQAFRGGITADQIISYLEQHSHPSMLAAKEHQAITSKSILPPTIVDQIKLWENERKRFKFNDGVAYNQFNSQSEYITLRDYAMSKSVLIWSMDQKRTMVVTKAGHEDVKKFWKRYQKQP